MPKKNSGGGPSVKALLRLWSVNVRNRDGNKCLVCGSTRYVQAHHLLPKERYPEYKLDESNGFSLCARHHKFGKFSAHRNPWWFGEWFQRNFPAMHQWVMARVGDRETEEGSK